MSREEAAEIAVQVLADGLAVALADAGWELTADINEPLRCRLGDREFSPLDEVLGMTEGDPPADRLGGASAGARHRGSAAAAVETRRAPCRVGPFGC